MKNKHHLMGWLLLAVALSPVSVVMADETEIYFADKSGDVSPNVLFLIDASGSMSQIVTGSDSRMDVLKSSFKNVMDNAPANLNVGLMHYANHGLGADYWWSSVKGVNFPVSPIDSAISSPITDGGAGMTDAYENLYKLPDPQPALTTPVRTFLSDVVNSWDADGYTPIVDSMYEAARYYRGDQLGWGLGLPTLGWAAHPLTYENSISCTAYQTASGGTSATPPVSPNNPTCVKEWGQCNGEILPATCQAQNYSACCDDPADPNDGWVSTGGDGSGYCVNEDYSCSSAITTCENRVCTAYNTSVDLSYRSPIKHSCQANYLVLMSDGKPEYPYYSGVIPPEVDGTLYYPPSSKRYPGGTGYAADKSSEIKVSPRLEDYMGVTNCADGSAIKDIAGGNIGYNSGVCGPELSEWLATTDQDGDSSNGDQVVKTYTVGFALNADPSDKGEEYLQLLASKGKGEYFPAGNEEELSSAFKAILSSISKAASSFSSPTYTVDTNSMLAHSDEVYIPVFDQNNKPVWSGNLKKFARTTDGKLVGEPIVRDPLTGTIISGTPIVNAEGEFLDSADDLWGGVSGTDVAAGGASSQLPVPDARKLYTDVSSNLSLTASTNALDATNIKVTDGLLVGLPDTGQVVKHFLPDADGDGTSCVGYYYDCAGTKHNVLGDYSTKVGCVTIANVAVTCSSTDYLTDSAREQLLDFVRGDADPDPAVTTPRQHMGDMLNSKPLVVDYGDGEQRIFAATNEGFLHSIDTDSGVEQWAFMPKDLLPNIKKFMENLPSKDHVYGIDGPLTLWDYDTNNDGEINSTDGDKRVLFFGLRRGGDAYYALDVTLPNAPKILWKKENATGADDQAWYELGETWSKPSLAKMRIGSATSSQVRNVVVFGAGYDAEKDVENTPATQDQPAVVRTADQLGSDVMIVDALTGELLWSLQKSLYNNSSLLNPIKDSIPGDIRVMDMDRNGVLDRLYFSDTGGNVWRVDMDHDLRDGDPDMYNYSDAILTKIAALGTDGDYGTDTRKFFYEPDVALIQHNGKTRMTIALGSGYRTHPLNTHTNDRFYVLMDPNVYNEPATTGEKAFTTITNADLTNARGTLGEAGSFDDAEDSLLRENDSDNHMGWYYDFDNKGEKVLASAVSFLNKVVFTTFAPVDESGNEPSDDPCVVPPNSARAYVLDLFTGTAVADLDRTSSTAAGNNNVGGKDDFVVAGVNEILDAAKVIFRLPSAADGGDCEEGDCQQTVEIRVGKMEMPVMDDANSANDVTSNGVKDIAAKTDLTDIMPRMFWLDHNATE
ncbi:PilC/PilY family type IV pilus protein [Thiothrix lacustris]|uniref:PilC/PilY family type IV pilus protein n=1 Tax=Thiothrix lacustris TaxID=525917 RepID=UPI000491A970|nr:PilC/PilY family type IV pilus protein [Thiothrix lacustris]